MCSTLDLEFKTEKQFEMLDIEWILIFVLLGAFVGFMAGLFGIGGGGIMVPVLSSIFIFQGIPVETVMHLALGTSMASIIVTSTSSMYAHHLKNGVIWQIVRSMVPGVIAGTFLTTLFVPYISSFYLALFFSIFMAYISVRMFLNTKTKSRRNPVGAAGLLSAGTGIGVISALVSIGGGSLTVPYLTWQSIDIKKAIGTSAAIGVPISIAGTLGYIYSGWGEQTDISYTFGFVYLPAVLLISVASSFTVPYGVRLAHKLKVATLKKAFSVLLIVLSIKMFFSVM